MVQPPIRREIRFILNGEDVVVPELRAEETLLDFLRLRRALRGTKEGCAEGDCGACTVLVGRLTGKGLVYESVNACIRFLASLDRTHVVTVEHLSPPQGPLHPVQKALVAEHGSQCGFCTPGFVMSLYALWMREPNPTNAAVEKALQGNLCRCTGYEPIVRAARTITRHGALRSDPLVAERKDIIARLKALDDGARVEVGRGSHRIVLPADADDLADALVMEPTSTIVAGSTDVGLWVTKRMRDIEPAIFIGHLAGLRQIEESDNTLTIGACVSYSEAFEALGNKIPALGRLIDRIGGEQVRNMGTIGGNIANGSPIGDTPPPLIALGARLALRRGTDRRVIALEDFFIEYGRQDRRHGEFVEAVHIPLPAPRDLFRVYKVTKRRDEDITAVLGAFNLRLDADGKVDSARIAYGGMAGTPKRARHVEARLQGRDWNEATVEDAVAGFAEDFTPLSDMRASAEYRMLVAQNLLRRFHLETTDTRQPLTVGRGEAA